jgi:MOSC domain-containing protein YiiM
MPTLLSIQVARARRVQMTDVWVGDVLRFSHCELRVMQPREPCYKFNAVMGFSGAARATA